MKLVVIVCLLVSKKHDKRLPHIYRCFQLLTDLHMKVFLPIVEIIDRHLIGCTMHEQYRRIRRTVVRNELSYRTTAILMKLFSEKLY